MSSKLDTLAVCDFCSSIKNIKSFNKFKQAPFPTEYIRRYIYYCKDENNCKEDIHSLDNKDLKNLIRIAIANDKLKKKLKILLNDK